MVYVLFVVDVDRVVCAVLVLSVFYRRVAGFLTVIYFGNRIGLIVC